ncbi:MHC class I-like protein MILL2 isoform X3 [Peromyscus maniculatus bairdii]|uniref:MHC class I-like protein MILL2 isoform X3 n=1 Tax=Peromyscus maniculatus bairdii TaxID=230844 RepID=UPI00042AB498|nr:MHC class I-like protein MILL1 isoform X3 [Peromyscus maniculatus bairdii]
MKTMLSLEPRALVLVQLSLKCLLLEELLGTCAGTHTLHYNLMALSLEGTRKFEFRAQGYIDNEPFLRYEGYRRRAELWGPRIKGKGGAEIWTRETEDMQEKEEQLRRMLTEVMTQKGQHGGPPMVTVSRRPYPVGRITLTCWAFNLYTPVATLTWLQDGRPVQQHSFGPGTILPSGNGTFQTWVSIWVLPGQEPHFTCRLRHRNKNIDVPAALGPQARNSGGATSSASALVASAFPAMLVFLACA